MDDLRMECATRWERAMVKCFLSLYIDACHFSCMVQIKIKH